MVCREASKRLIEEQKIEKRVKTLPKVKDALVARIKQWEGDNDKIFMYLGRSFMKHIIDEDAAHHQKKKDVEQARKQKKKDGDENRYSVSSSSKTPGKAPKGKSSRMLGISSSNRAASSRVETPVAIMKSRNGLD